MHEKKVGLRATFPYIFKKREGKKAKPSKFHDRLLPGHYDIAFEITWKTITPCALNPVEDVTLPKSATNSEKEFLGYNRRWLTYDGRFVISPFTVKSAIANSFANLMGGCYRVNTVIESHRNLEKGQYPYIGAYKRYRVARDGSSKPGILVSISVLDNGDRKVEIQPVKEYHLKRGKNDLPQGLKPKDKIYAKVKNRGHFPPEIKEIRKNVSISESKYWEEVKYYGPFRYGKDQKPHKKIAHRFYKEINSKISGIVKKEHFLSRDELKTIVTLGGCSDRGVQIEWYQDLRDLKPGDFIYYEVFNNGTLTIGKNFLFKSIFYHEDTVPPENIECRDLDFLCPRCSMFGMTEKEDTETAESKVVGFKGRFRSSALISDVRVVKEVVINGKYKFIPHKSIMLRKWLDENGNEVAKQVLLPIMGPPKPNKRDVDGYYDKTTGFIKGAKVYCHGYLNDAENIGNIDNIPESENLNHRLRNFCQVLKPGIEFKGTVGAENCSVEELAAFLLLLNTQFSDHGFKIGLGKAFGMGSVTSRIQRVWIRRSDNYENWVPIDIKQLDEKSVLIELSKFISGIESAYTTLKKIREAFNKVSDMELYQLKYPTHGNKYWDKKQRDVYTPQA
ncbi:MAG: hypothetical protein N2513_09645 [Deltaproteobacteria bacterium]|nr:hypothetical protein [Deltaproteobacteria bacterium]